MGALLLHKTKRFLMRVRRWVYGMRMYIPLLREHHIRESMVGPLGFWNDLQKYQIGLLKEIGLKPCHTLLDLGCGPLQGGIEFIKYLNPGNYTGIDINPEKLSMAYAQIGRYNLSNKNPKLFFTENFGKDLLKRKAYDYCFASQILYYFNKEEMEYLFSVLLRILKPGGIFLGDINGPKHYEFKFPEHEHELHSVESITQLAEKYSFGVTSLGEINKFGYPKQLSLNTNVMLKIQKPC